MNWSAKNLTEEWRKFKQHAELMFQGPLKNVQEDSKCAYLLIWVGETGREIFNSWNLSDEDSKNLDALYTNFTTHTLPRKNSVFCRYIFQERRQQQGETFETFVTDLRNMVKDCSYDKPEEMVRDRIVSGVASQDVREKLLHEGDALTMQKAIEITTTFEATKKQLASMAAGDSVDALQARRKESTKFAARKTDIFFCRNCGSKHSRKQCPAFGKECLYCHKKNHFAKVCLKKRGSHNRIHNVEGEHDEDTANCQLVIDTIAHTTSQPRTAYAEIKLQTGNAMQFKLDTGAQVNVLPLSAYNKLRNPPSLKKSSQRLYGYTGRPLDVKGYVDMNCSHRDKQKHCRFYVANTEGHSQPILGLQTCLDLDLIRLILSVDSATAPITQDTVLTEYKQLFNGLGCLEGEVKIHLKPDATPVVHPARRVPHAIKDQLKKELDNMVETGIVAKVTEPTDWVNSLVVVQKPNGQLRICLDPRDLNSAIKRPHYPMPALEDALAKMTGAKFFSKLDARSGYWQMKLDTESSFLTTFNTPFGRYRFLRLPFGLVSAQDEFQRKMDEAFEGIAGVTALVDDILITGKTREEHDANLQAVLQRAAEKNLKLNPDKITIAAEEVEYFGHIVSAEGLKPDPSKVKAVQEMSPPANKKELQTILGMMTYLAKFAPKLSQTTQPMRELLKEENEFSWGREQEEALQQAKAIISSQPVLAFYDPAKPILLQVDASKHGLGAAIFQEDKPIAFASKSLNSSEQNYAQIEKELYAIAFGCKRFHQYIFGHRVTVQTDHKPLESISKKSLAAAPPRLQRMLLQLQKYDLHVVHVPGRNIPVADTLSRKFLPAEPEDCDTSEDINAHVHSIIENLPITDGKMKQLREATANDPQLQDLKSTIQDGWPELRKNCKKNIIEFWNFRDELSIIDGIIFKGEKVLIPVAMRPEMMKKIHSSHFGIEKTKQRARDIIFWPGMIKQIHDTVAACTICARMSPANPKEPLLPHEAPTRPWQKLGTDIFTWHDRSFLITVDYYSRYFEIDELTTTTSLAIIRKLSTHFARHGIPEVLISDNGPQFVSEDFNQFSATWDFKHITSSPGYPQSNGLAEKTVQTAKHILSKAKADGSNPFLALLEYRSTPVDSLASPAQLLMGRQLRSILPTSAKHLQPKTINPSEVAARRLHLQAKQKKYYDQNAHPLPPMKTGDNVYVQLSKGDNWTPAQIMEPSSTPRSYIVETNDGRTFRRNRRCLKPRAPLPPNDLPEQPTTAPEPEGNRTIPPPPQGTYTTRSGRVVKGPKRLDL